MVVLMPTAKEVATLVVCDVEDGSCPCGWAHGPGFTPTPPPVPGSLQVGVYLRPGDTAEDL
jgi:hypothetical protein